MMLAVLAVLTIQGPSPNDSGAAIFRNSCRMCHGANGRGDSTMIARLGVRPANLARCSESTAEPEGRWRQVVTRGGAAVGLSDRMPAFGASLTPRQIDAVVRYIRSLCGESGWPPGDLNFPRAFLVEKAFPENEWVLVAHGARQELIYEGRIGKRFQVEAEWHTVFDGMGKAFDGVAAAFKYNVWHSLRARSLATLGAEVNPPVGREDAWEVEPYVAFGANPGRVLAVQGQVVGVWEDARYRATEYRLGAGKQIGRFSPMIEFGWTEPREEARQLAWYPQLWFQLSRLGHVAGSVGVELPATGPDRRGKLFGFLLWDFGDGSLLHGW